MLMSWTREIAKVIHSMSMGMWISLSLSVIGIGCWIIQMILGMQVTNLDNFNAWGVYIAGFVLATGIAAGCLLFSAFPWLFAWGENYRKYSFISALFGGSIAVMAAGLFVLADLGSPERIWLFVTKLRLSSPLAWDAVSLASFIILGICFARILCSYYKNKTTLNRVRSMALAVFTGGLLVTLTSFAFAGQVGRPLWNNAGQTLSFLFAAIIASLCVLIPVFSWLAKNKKIDLKQQILAKICNMTAMFILGELIFVFSEILIGLYAGAGEDYAAAKWLLSGNGAIFFWIEMTCLLSAFLFLISSNVKFHLLGGLFGLAGVFFIKYNMLQSQLMHPLISNSGPFIYTIRADYFYIPSFIETGICVGIVAFSVFVCQIGMRYLPKIDDMEKA